MKLQPNSPVRSRVGIRSPVRNVTIPAGSKGVVLEVFSNPEGYLVEFVSDDKDEEQRGCCDVLALTPEQVEGGE